MTFQLKFENGNNIIKYEMKLIYNNKLYIKYLKGGYLLGLYYMIL